MAERRADGTFSKGPGRKPGAVIKAVASTRERFAELLSGNMERLESDLASLAPSDRVDATIRLAAYVVPKPTEQMEYNSTHYARSVEIILAHAAKLAWNEDFPSTMMQLKELMRLAALAQWGELEPIKP